QRLSRSIHRRPAGHVHARDLRQRMDARVGPPRNPQPLERPVHPSERIPPDAFDRAQARLRGPTAEPRPVVLERQLEAHWRISSNAVQEDEWRVEIDLDDEAHGFGLGERFRAHDLDDEARKRLGHRIGVPRDGPHVFLYAGDEAGANQAEMIARELVATDDLSADITVTRWHPLEEEWRAPRFPLPRREEEQQEELEGREETERLEGTYDWLVKIDMPSRSEAEKLEELLQGEGLSVHRRWRYVTVD